ncbi:MAG: hypothetical protein AAF625_01815 [Pseudomonadota bacterium]
MNDLIVAPNERGVIRLFKLSMRPEEARFLREPGAADQVLGVQGLDADHIDIFPVSDLQDLGLWGYLTDGCGVSEDQLDHDALDAVEGWVLILRSAAFGGRAATLTPDPRLHLIGLYTEEATNWTGGTIATESAKPFSAPRTPASDRHPRRAGSALVAVIGLLVLGGVLWLVL